MDNSIIGILSGELAGREQKLWAEINLGALVRNYKRIYELVKKKSAEAEIISVVKADAYGHGAHESVLALAEAGARFFAVSSVAEALDIRFALKDKNFKEKIEIIILGYTVENDVDLLYKYDIIQTIFSLEYAESLNRACADKLGADKKLRVHMKLDTGMNRIGFNSKDDVDVSEMIRAAKLDNLVCEGIFTHFACADEAGGEMTALQIERFEKSVRELEARGINFKMKHVCNSAGTLRDDTCAYDALRVGIILYGLAPSADFALDDFESAMTLKAKVAHVHKLKRGESVSYGATFTADSDMTLATVPAGYGDGFIRAYSGASVKIGDRYCPIVGRICMDQFMIDVTGVDVKRGDEVVLFDSPEMIENLARLSHTISYEVLCIIGKRVPRIYVNK